MVIVQTKSAGSLVQKICFNILSKSLKVSPRNQATREVFPAFLGLTDPSSRLFIDKVRAINIFEMIGRFAWEFSGNDSLEAIQYYSSSAFRFANEKGIVPSAYGKRLFTGISTIHHAIGNLKLDPDSRRAFVLILNPDDSMDTTFEFPCISGLHFLIREGKLHMITYARSESCYRILPFDIFLFTMIQEYVAVNLNLPMGMYHHFCGSAHFYEHEESKVIDFVSQKIQPITMRPVFEGDDLLLLKDFFEMERRFRIDTQFVEQNLADLEAIQDCELGQFAIILAIYAHHKHSKPDYRHLVEMLEPHYKILVNQRLEAMNDVQQSK